MHLHCLVLDNLTRDKNMVLTITPYVYKMMTWENQKLIIICRMKIKENLQCLQSMTLPLVGFANYDNTSKVALSVLKH